MLRDKIASILTRYPETRGNDMLLYYIYLVEEQISTDLKDLAENPKNIFESISRARRKAQEINPLLLPDRHITRRKNQLEEQFREEYKGL